MSVELPPQQENKLVKYSFRDLITNFRHILGGVVLDIKEGGRIVESDEDWNIITYGKVEKETITAIKNVVNAVLAEMGYKGDNPQLRISEGEIILPSGEATPAIMETTQRGVKIIRLSRIAVQKTSAYKQGIRENIGLSLNAAHEAAHYVQSFRDEVDMHEIDAKDLKTALALINHPLELEANQVAENVIKRIYGIDLCFS